MHDERFVIVPEFFGRASEMRGCIDRHFSEPYRQSADTHQVWNYWFVPGLYTYLRTTPNKVIDNALVEDFVRRLKLWALEQLGLSVVTAPLLSMYVDGCRQGIHNDSENGRFGYVFSLTRWDDRHFTGGETILFSEEPYMGTLRMTRHGASTSFLDSVPARFNQLLVFDDRVLHAVERIEGGMNPLDSRVVLHGHIQDGGAVIEGSLTTADVEAAFLPTAETIERWAAAAFPGLHGVVSFRLEFASDGTITSLNRLIDRLFVTRGSQPAPGEVASAIGERIRPIRMPSSHGTSRLFVPFVFDARA